MTEWRRARAWTRRLAASLWPRADADRQLQQELDGHVQLHIDDNIRAGMTPAEARRQALLRLGGVDQVAESWRDRRGLPRVESLVRDVRDGVRGLSRSPGVTTVAIVSLALGIGANVAVFSIVDRVLLRPLPVPDPDRLVQLAIPETRETFSYPVWRELAARPGGLEPFAWSGATFAVSAGGEVERVDGFYVSGGFFDRLGIDPAVGRMLTVADDSRGGGPDGPVAVISHAFWESAFGGEAGVVGRALQVGRVSVTVVGVMPPDFYGPYVGRRYDVAVPIGILGLVTGDDARFERRTTSWLRIMARLPADLPPHDGLERATAGLTAALPAIRSATMPEGQSPEFEASYLRTITVEPAPGGPDGTRRYYQRPLMLLFGVVALVLAIACVNVANLLLAQSVNRRPELELRLALGASRWRLARQVFVECVLLAGAGAAAGVLVAGWGGAVLVRQLSTAVDPVQVNLSVDWRVLAFATGLGMLVAVLFGLAPALRARHVTPRGGGAQVGRRVVETSGRVAGALLVGQIALSLVLVLGAGLFVRTFTALVTLDPGFDRRAVVVADVDSRQSISDPSARLPRYEEVRRAVAALPGVEAAALSVVTPISFNSWSTTLEPAAGPGAGDGTDVWVNIVSPGWFGTYGIPLLAGRDFSSADAADGEPVVVVNEALVRQVFPDGRALGRQLRELAGPGQRGVARTIVGVVGDAMYESLREAPPPTMYRVLTQGPAQATISLSVRVARGDPSAIAPAVLAAIARQDPDLVTGVQSLQEQIGASFVRERVLAMLAATFGAIGLLLAAIGLFGVMSYAVNRHRRALAIRVALGASPRAVVRLVMSRVTVVLLVGLALGLGLGTWLSRYTQALLFGVEPGDVATTAGAAIVLSVVALLAGWWPARRAAKADPTEVLRAG